MKIGKSNIFKLTYLAGQTYTESKLGAESNKYLFIFYLRQWIQILDIFLAEKGGLASAVTSPSLSPGLRTTHTYTEKLVSDHNPLHQVTENPAAF
jgi:hypothetical protein